MLFVDKTISQSGVAFTVIVAVVVALVVVAAIVVVIVVVFIRRRRHRLLKTGIFKLYTVNHKKGGSTFVTITLENLDRFL